MECGNGFYVNDGQCACISMNWIAQCGRLLLYTRHILLWTTTKLTVLFGSLLLLGFSSKSALAAQTVIDVDIVISENVNCVTANLFLFYFFPLLLLLLCPLVCCYYAFDSNQCVPIWWSLLPMKEKWIEKKMPNKKANCVGDRFGTTLVLCGIVDMEKSVRWLFVVRVFGVHVSSFQQKQTSTNSPKSKRMWSGCAARVMQKAMP